MNRAVAAEALGTALLLAIVVGSGIMADRLSGGNVAIALLANSIVTGAGLIVLIQMIGPLSGAHFNPAVTLVMLMRREMGGGMAVAYMAAQLIGAVAGTWTAHLMFAEPLLQLSHHPRDGLGLAFAEGVASFGLIGTILAVRRSNPGFVAVAVGLYICAAYWFTASTAFANPAATIARSLTGSFTGIAPVSAAPFIAAQLIGALAAWRIFGWLHRENATA